MCDQNQGGGLIAVKGEQQVGNALTGLAIEIAGRFISKQQVRATAEGASQRHALLFTAGKLSGQMLQTPAQPQLFQQSDCLSAAGFVAFTTQQRGKLHVLQRTEGRHQHKRLKDEANMTCTQRRALFFIHLMQRLPHQLHLTCAAIVQPGEDAQQRGLARSRLTNQRNALCRFDNQLNSGEDGKLMLPLTDGFTKIMNFNNVFRWHYLVLFLFTLITVQTRAADKLLILGDSLSAGYRMPANEAWPQLLNKKWQNAPEVVNGSISGDTAAQGLARLSKLLAQHQPRWVLIELGGNDGLRGFAPKRIASDLQQAITQVKAAHAQPLLMQVRLPANYGRRYTEAFSAIYPQLAKQNEIPLVPFFMEQVYLKPDWMQQDGIHPAPQAQAFIADIMAKSLAPLVKHE